MRYWHQWDALCSDSVRYGLAKLGFTALLQKPQPLVADLPFVRSPTPLLTCILGYLLIVLVGLALQSGKRPGVKKADGNSVRSAVLVHNVLLIALSGYMCVAAVYEAVANKYNFWGNEYDSRQTGMARVVYIFFISKLYEFLDTVRSRSGRSRQLGALNSCARDSGDQVAGLRQLDNSAARALLAPALTHTSMPDTARSHS